MKKLILTDDLKSKLNRSNCIGEGNEGRVYIYNSTDTIKMYNIFKKMLNDDSHIITTLEEEASEMYHDKLLELDLRQNLIGRTNLPKGYIDYNGFTVGSILTFHDNHAALVTHYFDDDETILHTFKEINKSIRELVTYCIYPTDIHEQNILIENKTLFPEIIDMDGEYIHITNHPDKDEESYSFYKMMQLFINYVRLKKSNNTRLTDEEIFENINMGKKYIDLLLSGKASYEELENLFDYCLKDEILKKAPTYRLLRRF